MRGRSGSENETATPLGETIPARRCCFPPIVPDGRRKRRAQASSVSMRAKIHAVSQPMTRGAAKQAAVLAIV